MTRQEMIKKLTEIKDEIAINRESELTEFVLHKKGVLKDENRKLERV